MHHTDRKRVTRVKLLALGLITCAAIQCCRANPPRSRAPLKPLKLASLRDDDINLVRSDDKDEHQLYLLGLFDLRTSGAGECAHFNLDPGHETWQRPMQNLEAFLWAIDQVNADTRLLPGVKLGSIVLDTCSSHLRTVMQLTQFLLGDKPVERRSRMPDASQVAAVVNDIADWPTLEATLRILNQLKTTTFVTQNRASRFERLVQEYQRQQAPTEVAPMFRTGTSNEQLAEAVASFVEHMNWTYVSVVYDDRDDMLDLNEKLVRKLATSGLQVALNERVDSSNLWRLFHRLAVKEALGARVVISLVSPAGAQLLLDHMRTMRAQQQAQTHHLVGRLLWVSVSDREPYYAAATEALGTVLVSSSASLPEPFRSHYNGPQAGKNNRWWEDWRRQHQQTAATKVLCAGSSGGADCADQLQQPATALSARGWEHNGLSVINAVMIAAQGLELARRSAGCGGTGEESHAGASQCLSHSDQINSLPVIIRNNLTDLTTESSIGSHASVPDENHFLRRYAAAAAAGSSSIPAASAPELNKQPQLADGEFLGFNPATNQLVQNFKIYNLRHLQANSIGFVKFGEFNERYGMRLNAAKARYYSQGGVKNDQPLDSVRSECQDESKCRSTTTFAAKLKPFHQPQAPGDAAAGAGNGASSISGAEEEATAGVGTSLFKLDHPAFARPPGADEADKMQEVNHHLYTATDANQFYTMSSGGFSHFNWSESPEDLFNVIVLLPLHRTANNNCAPRSQPLDMQAFQWLAAIAYAQEQLSAMPANNSDRIRLTTTVIDYCGQAELAKRLLLGYLEANDNSMQFGHLGEPISLLDFDTQLAETLHKELEEEAITHVTFDRPGASSLSNHRTVPTSPEFILPSEMIEIEALVDLISRVGGSRWKMVHLIFTDSDEYRDRFLNLAILRGICVNKIISISGRTDAKSYGSRELYQEDIRRIFRANFQAASNETRVLVVLGSPRPETNQLILESATDSMLDDYAWVVNHNWIQSVEIQAERSELAGNQEPSNYRLPVNLIGTRLEVLEDQEFRSFLASLNPNKYTTTQLPSRLLDQFWQQNFNCSLPVPKSSLPSGAATCSTKLQLDPQALDIDYRVPYIVKVITDLHKALQSHKPGTKNYKQYLAPQRYNYGFEIVHRLRSVQTETSRRKQRVQNSRRLAMESNLPLVSVGGWHLKSRLLLKPELEGLGKNLATGSTEGGELEVYGSLQSLSLIDSFCTTNRSCLGCRKQREHEIAIIERDRARSSLNGNSSPKVIDWLPRLTDHQNSDEIAGSSSSKVFRSSVYQFPEITANTTSSSSQPISKPYPPNRSSITSRYELAPANGFSLTEALAISVLSLMSAVFLLFAMTFLYPSAMERKLGAPSRYLTPETVENQLTSINDYFLFAGLLMLCSINVAFLLPATMTICWFRRIGLASSYTVILSSILVMVISCYLRRMSRSKKETPPPNQFYDAADVAVANQENYQVDDEVELTFESLPQEGPSQAGPECSGQSRSLKEDAKGDDALRHIVNNKKPTASKPDSPTSLMGLSISLITVQLLVSLAWSMKQPPEPTLYQGCWRCASPHRSPTLFLYELFLSLVYPALLLLPTWLLSIITFKSISTHQDEFIKKNFLSSKSNQTHQTHSQATLNEIHSLKSQMRDAKALVLTTTSLVILWSITTLIMLSKSHPLLVAAYDNNPTHEPLAQRLHESTLVYANLLSACLVYLLLFNYRLHLFGSLRCPSAMVKKHQRATNKGHSQPHSYPLDGVLDGELSGKASKARSKSFFSSSSISSRQELLRLHQFNTYCTYSATSQLAADQIGRDTNYITSGSQSQRSANKGRLSAGKIKKRGRTPFFSISPYGSATREPSSNSNRKQQSDQGPSSAGGLQRRQSASSVTSSTAQLVFDDSNSISYCADDHDDDCDINYLDDTISYTSSVASSSTSQLQGNELYPLDYSIQLDPSQLTASGGGGGAGNGPEGPSRLHNRLSFRRGTSFRNNTKLSSVSEETGGEKKTDLKETGS